MCTSESMENSENVVEQVQPLSDVMGSEEATPRCSMPADWEMKHLYSIACRASSLGLDSAIPDSQGTFVSAALEIKSWP